MKELADCLPGSKKTFSRDLKLLRQAGAPIVYKVPRRAFLLKREGLDPAVQPDSPTQARTLTHLRRLLCMMDDLPWADCDLWYREQFPGVSRRTMQRDFALLCSIGYRVKYETEEFNCHDAGMDQPQAITTVTGPWARMTCQSSRRYECGSLQYLWGKSLDSRPV